MRNHLPARSGRMLAVAAVTALTLSGCGGTAEDENSATDTTSSASPTSASPTPSPTSASPTSSETAGTAAGTAILTAAQTGLTAVGSGDVVSVESEDQGERWEVEVFTSDGTKHEVDVSADGTAVVSGPKAENQDQEDAAKYRSRLSQAELGFPAAVDQLAAVVPGEITEVDLDDTDGKVVWEADIIDDQGRKHEVAIDAGTGEVVENRIDR